LTKIGELNQDSTVRKIRTVEKEGDRTVISKHPSNIFDSEELEKESNVQKMHVDNSKKAVSFYNQ